MTRGEFFTAIQPLFPGFEGIVHTVGLGIVAAIVLTPAERFAPAHPQPLFLRKGLLLDCAYWFMTPLLTRCITGAVLAALLFVFAFCVGFEKFSADFLTRGFGPISRQPLWLQAIEILLISDFVDYWTHRTLHRSSLWRIHAVHHSPEEMNWISSSRVHPLNDLITRCFQLLPILVFGFSAVAIMSVVPLVAFYVMFLHANLRWDFGPLRWVLVSPAYHRWHHTSDEEGLDKNFAGIFPIWDVLFGTAYFPRALPRKYGLKGKQMPESFVEHMLFPFASRAKEAHGTTSASAQTAGSLSTSGAGGNAGSHSAG
jgi:sterol desaturase/sphingolipid hydroxylase (fatty acid hydroxylase superfamily)